MYIICIYKYTYMHTYIYKYMCIRVRTGEPGSGNCARLLQHTAATGLGHYICIRCDDCTSIYLSIYLYKHT